MAYISLGNLTRYDGKLKDWVDDRYASERYSNWQKTEKAGAVTCYPVPESRMEPVVEFKFNETLPTEGEKGPDNPSTIEGISSVKIMHAGKNILRQRPSITYPSTSTYNDVTFTVNADKSITIDGTATALTQYFLSVGESAIYLHKGIRYSFSGTRSDFGTEGYLHLARGNFYKSLNGSVQTANNFTPVESGVHMIFFELREGKTINNATIYPQLEVASAATDYSKFVYNDISISLGSTYYGGYVDVANGILTVTANGGYISSFTTAGISGVDTQTTNTMAFGCIGSHEHGGNITPDIGACNRFDFHQSNRDIEHWRQVGYFGDNRYVVFINKSRLDLSGAVDPSNPTTNEWIAAGNAWLANHPLFIASSIATPYTVLIPPAEIRSLPFLNKMQPRLNTLFTDAESIQVGYQKSPIRTQYELENAILSLGGNE